MLLGFRREGNIVSDWQLLFRVADRPCVIFSFRELSLGILGRTRLLKRLENFVIIEAGGKRGVG